MIQYRVAVLAKDMIPFGLRLVLDHLGGSESINITSTEYWRSNKSFYFTIRPSDSPILRASPDPSPDLQSQTPGGNNKKIVEPMLNQPSRSPLLTVFG